MIPKTKIATILLEARNVEARICLLRLELHFLQSPRIQSTQNGKDSSAFLGLTNDRKFLPTL